MEKFSKKLHDYLLWQLIKPLNCAKSFLFQSLSMNLQRGNALCVMGTVALILVIVKSNFVKLNTVFFFVAHSDEKLLDTVYAIILKKLHADNSEERAAALKLIHNLPPLCR